MNDPQSLRRRAERILPVPDSGGGVQPSTAQYAPYAPRVIAVLDHIDGDILYWQRIRYANRRIPKVPRPAYAGTPGDPNDPPRAEVAGEYERFGPIKKGYPLETTDPADYEGVKWGSAAIDKTTTPVWATFRHGAWIIELMGGGSPIRFVRVLDTLPTNTPSALWLVIQPVKYDKVHGNWIDDVPPSPTPPVEGPPPPPPPEYAEVWPNYTGAHYLPMKSGQPGDVLPALILPVFAFGGSQYVMQKNRWFIGKPAPGVAQSDCVVSLVP